MRYIPIVLLAAALAGCGSRRADGEVDPGKWRQTVTIKSVELPGAPPEVAQLMQAMVGQSKSEEICMGPEQAKTGVKDLSKGFDRGDCSAADFTTSGGKIDGKVSCKAKDGASTAEMVIGGTYEPTKIDMTADISGTNPETSGIKMVIRMQMQAERIGDCAK